MRALLIYGTGGLGREALEIAEASDEWRPLGFIDDNPAKAGQLVHGVPTHPLRDWIELDMDASVCLAVGDPALRLRLRETLESAGRNQFGTLVHPRAQVGRRVTIGDGCIIFAGASITTDATLGRHVVVNPGALIAHDAVIEDLALVAPGAAVSGAVYVGEGAYLGTNASVLQGLRIGEWSVVGAGAVVREDVPANTTVVGVPARVVGVRPSGWQKEK